MSALEQIEEQIKQLSFADQIVLRGWLEDLLEDRFELTNEFMAEIEAGMNDITNGRYRVGR